MKIMTSAIITSSSSNHPMIVYGPVTRRYALVWDDRAERPNKDRVPALPFIFHDVSLYPTLAQIHEMKTSGKLSSCSIAAAGHSGDDSPEISLPAGLSPYLTFGQFCLFTSELKHASDIRMSRIEPKSKCGPQSAPALIPDCEPVLVASQRDVTNFDIFLGGSCNPTTWRTDIAIPMLKSMGITFYNPQVSHWKPELIELENSAKDNADVLFFVIDNQTRSVAGSVEAAHIAAQNKKLILVIHPYPQSGTVIHGETINDEELKDLTQGQNYLQDVVERQGIPVFEQIPVALASACRIIRERIRPQDLTREDNVNPVRFGHVKLANKLLQLREIFDSLDVDRRGFISLSDFRLAFRSVSGREMTVDELKAVAAGHFQSSLLSRSPGLKKDLSNQVPSTVNLDQIDINFDQFCVIVSEFKYSNSANKSLEMISGKMFTILAHPFLRTINWIWRLGGFGSMGGGLGGGGGQSSSSSSSSPLRRAHLKHGSSVFDNASRDVYLGGPNDESDPWREDLAIPVIRKHGLRYYSPRKGDWEERFTPSEAFYIENCSVLFFNISSTSRAHASMIQAAYYIGLNCRMVLCIQNLEAGEIINGEKISPAAAKDYNRGRAYLSNLASRSGLPVFSQIEEAIDKCVEMCLNLPA